MNAVLFLSLSLFGQTTLDDGSLVLLENCNYWVERYTHASIGHVAVAANEGKQTWIYEATPGRVRRLTWADYQAELGQLNADRQQKQKQPIVAWVMKPKTALNNTQSVALKNYLDSQLNRRYSVRGIVRGSTGDGIHCAELASHALNASEQACIVNCHKQSPAAVRDLAQPGYASAEQVRIALPEAEDSWCARSWRGWAHFAMMCRWSCGEAWSFCW
jgi:hypothetical protein